MESPETARVEEAESAFPMVRIPAIDEVVAVEVERKFETSRKLPTESARTEMSPANVEVAVEVEVM